MSKFRCSLDWKIQYNSNKKGYASALELYPFLKQEASAGVYNAPQSGSQGNSISGSTAVTDLTTIVSDNAFNIAVDGKDPILITVDTSTANTGADTADELELAINAALETENVDCRVWVKFDVDHYEIYSQTTGSLSSIVITDALTNNIADDLEIGVLNGGTEQVGTDSEDWIYVKAANVNFSQEFEQSAHRSGRQASSIYRKKKMVEGSLETYCLLGANASSDIYMPAGLKTILKSAFGNQSVDTASRAVFDMKQPHSTYFSMVTANNVYSQTTNGCYLKTWNLELPGDDAASISCDLKGRDSKVTIPSKVSAATTGSAVVTVSSNEGNNFEEGSRVMICSADGRTITEGYAGDLYVESLDLTLDTITLNRAVDTELAGFVVPYFPIFGYNIPADDAQISTDLQGTIEFDGVVVDTITSASVSVDPQVTDLDGYYGADGNRGFVDSSRANITVSATMHLTGEQANLILKAKRFKEFSFNPVVGFNSGQKMKVKCPRVVFQVPAVEIPEDGPVEVTLEGQALQTRAGALDAIEIEFTAS